MTPISGGRKRPYRMSVDRIDRSGGYTPDNIRITTAIAKIALMDWQFSDFLEMRRAVSATHGKRRKRSFRDQCVQHRRQESKGDI